MWKMVEKHLDIEAKRVQIQGGKSLTYKYQDQLYQNAGLENGKWVKDHGTQVSWKNLMDALQKYIDNSQLWTTERCINHWCQQVGNAQLILPAHVINEYSRSDRSFMPCPQFNETQLPRTGLAVWSGGADSNVGKSCAWVRSEFSCGLRAGVGNIDPNTECYRNHLSAAMFFGVPNGPINQVCHFVRPARDDLSALSLLHDIRTKQREQLISSVTYLCKPNLNV